MEQQKSLKKTFTMNYPLTIYPKFWKFCKWKNWWKTSKEYPNLKFSPFFFSTIIQNGDVMSGGMIFGVDPKKAQINPIYKEAIGVTNK